MKNLIIIFLVLGVNCANAQVKLLDMRHGKYLENSLKDNFVGNWKTKDNNFKVSIAKEKKHIKRNDIDVYVDFLKIKINRFVSEGKEISNMFTSEISLLSIANDDFFSGIYRDTITGNNVKIKLKHINNSELQLTTDLPEIDLTNHPEKGTVFPKNVNLRKN